MSHCQYLNTDLDIESQEDLSPLIQQLGERVLVLYHGETQTIGHQLASFEINMDHADADATINHLCIVIETLPERERAIWNNCSTRLFDIGYACTSGTESVRSYSELCAATVSRVAALGASIAITMYPDYEQAHQVGTPDAAIK
ncbi:MAG: hypothetical protein CDV28_11131 [Candidatus Electronema aureum]|uniref:Uncharacterized protein n=1 Tax=Candidatus Electronema aureum TaxID=2005002 RepID=A0A521G264_9BACT|nr:MAG: hypothetical protein CDV28_11131 [Candidatus Electronema aureum]